jgi:hypothetical protein
MAASIANKFYRAPAIPANVETTLFNLVFTGVVNVAFYSVTELKVVSPSGNKDFIVRVYFNGVQIDTQRASVSEADGQVDIKTLNIKMFNNGTLKATVVHFDTTKSHDFESTLVGNGFA